MNGTVRKFLLECLRDPQAKKYWRIQQFKELAHSMGLGSNVVGQGNRKTGLPSTYRPVGPTCPSYCEYLNKGCYARQSYTGMNQQNSSAEGKPSSVAAIIAMIVANRHKDPARLHVSGDFMDDGKIDSKYISELVFSAQEINKIYPCNTAAFSYTHIKPSKFERYRLQLKQARIIVLYSGQLQAGGAVVYPHNKVNEIRDQNPDLYVVKCLAQLKQNHEITCKDCRICWQAEEKNICVVFDPHGSAKRSLPTLQL